MKHIVFASAIALTLSGCGTTEGLLVGLSAAGGIISSMASSPDYTKYADTCKEIIQANRDAAEAESNVLVEVAKDKTMGSQVLLYMALKPKTSAFAQCALALPRGFLTQLAESGNLLNFVATIYGENRADARSQRALQINKELGLANMSHQQEMQQLENALFIRLSGNPIDAFNAAKPAASAGAAE